MLADPLSMFPHQLFTLLKPRVNVLLTVKLVFNGEKSFDENKVGDNAGKVVYPPDDLSKAVVDKCINEEGTEAGDENAEQHEKLCGGSNLQ